MKYFNLRYTSIFLFLISISSYGQDKLILKNGTIISCKIAAISENTITYKDTLEASLLITVLKNTILIAEYKTGEIYIFGQDEKKVNSKINLLNETYEQQKVREIKEWKDREGEMPNGILGFYPVQIVAGRFTVSYERFISNKTIGICIPISLTYDMFNRSNRASSNQNNNNSNGNFGVIGGLDINYYHTLEPELSYFFGPRFRYGTAMTFGGIEYFSFQLQNGLMRSRGKNFTNSLSIGFGFFKLSKKYANLPGYESNQVYPSGSITWRIGLRL